MDVVGGPAAAPQGWAARPALDLTGDPAILTASRMTSVPTASLAPGDRLRPPGRRRARALDERQLAEHRRGAGGGAPSRFSHDCVVGYDGGRIAAERLADYVVVTPSEHIPRIQEAQASAYHALRELVG